MSKELKPSAFFKAPIFVASVIVVLVTFYTPSFLMPIIKHVFGGWWFLLVFIAIIIIIGTILTVWRAKNKEEGIQLVRKPEMEMWKNFGATKEEKEKNIKKMFDTKQGSVYIGARVTAANGAYYQFSISRNVATMEQREREFLRTTYLLYNSGKLTDNQYAYYAFGLINGEGKASIDQWAYQGFTSNDAKDGPSIVKSYQSYVDGTVDTAINKLLQIMEKLGQEDDGNKNIREIKGRIHGGAVWLSDDEVESTVFKGNGKYQLKLGLLEDSNHLLGFSGEGSLITIAPPGSGKTQCFVIPNMLSWQGAALVLDIKGEIYEATSRWREKNVGPVYKFSPLDPANSNSYNPLVFIRNDADYIWEDSRFLADMMMVPSGATDRFWEDSARDLLTSALAYVSFSNEPDDRPMSKILDLIYGIGLDEMFTALKTNMFVAAMRQTGHSLSVMEKKTMDSVLKTAQSSLSAWQGERIAKVTKKSDWSPLDLRKGSPTIYICINPNEIDSYMSVLRVFIAQHIRMLISERPPRDSAPVLFMLDELPRLKNMPPVEEALDIGRQYGIKLWMFTQSYGQLKIAYPDAERMLGSCVVRTFMNVPLNDELATKLSDQLGYREGPLDATKQKLVEPLELAGPNYRDTILVLATNTKPARLRKRFAYEDTELKSRMN